MRIAAALLATLSTLSGPALALAGDEKDAPAPTAIRLSFKMDPRVLGPTYGGERWISPRTYQGASAQSTVEARASAVDAKGRPTKVDIDWKPSDPEMVIVVPPRGEQVKITVKRPGESSLVLESGGVSRKLVVKVVDNGRSRQVTITQ